MDYYKRYMGDYGRDTSRLSMIEHGAYNLLLDDYYSTRTPLPADLNELHRICRATTKPEQTAVELVAKRYFPVCDDGLRHSKRADEEIAKWEVMAEENREKGKLGGRPKKNPSGNPPGNPTGSGGDNPDETQRVNGGLEKGPVLETRRKPSPNPNPNPRPILSHSLTQSARAGEEPNGHAEPRGDDFNQLQLVKAGYPKGDYDQADWQEGQRGISRWIDERGFTWAQVIEGSQRYGVQQTAKGNIGTKFVKSPKTFFAYHPTSAPRFLEEFPVSESRAPEAAPRKRWHPDDGDPTEPKAATTS